jgi:hypothetical protein
MSKNFVTRILLSSFIIIAVFATSCKKDKTTACYVSIKDITGFYRITKIMIAGSDVTSTYMTPCRKSSDLQLYSSKVAIYEETAPSCNGTGGGTWDLDYSTNKITIIDKYGNSEEFSLKSKKEVAFDIAHKILDITNNK